MKKALYVLALGVLACDVSKDTGDAENPLDVFEDGAVTTVCAADGDFDFTVSASNLSAFDGAVAWSVAVQPSTSPHTDEDHIVVLLEDTIVDGGFDARCASSLSDNLNYPSNAIIIDADGNGVCSADDQIVVYQWYGWMEMVALTLDSTTMFQTIGTETTWGDRDLCAYYVPEDG